MNLKKIIEIIYDKRYIIALITFLVLFAFKINFSSISVWSRYIDSKSSEIIGIGRSIRSDEWLVQTPFFLSQSMNENSYSLINENVGYSGQNMLMVYPAPVVDITIIGKVFNLGFILFGRDYGLSWYFSLKMIMCILMSIEIVSILTKKNKVLSLIFGLWLGFTPSVMWWFSSSGDVTIYAFAIIVIFYYYFEHLDIKIYKKILLGIAMISALVGFVLCFYPALQVPVIYIILAFIIPKIIFNIKKLKKEDYLIIISCIVIAISILGWYLYNNLDYIKLEMNTVYPGKRFDNGGSMGLRNVINYFFNFFTPFTGKKLPELNTNQCEISASIFPFIGMISVLFYYIIRKIKSKENIKNLFKSERSLVAILLCAVFIFQFIFSSVGIPKWLAKISFMYLSTSPRTTISMGIIGIMLCIYIFNKLINNKEYIFNKKVAVIISLVTTVISGILIYHYNLNIYFDTIKVIILLPIVFILTYSFLSANKKLFLIIIFLITIETGMTINPINYSTTAIYESNISKKINEINDENKDKKWIANTNVLAQYLIANGVKTINGINYYPQFEMLKLLDKEGKYEDVYNRYAHISIALSDETKFELTANDSYTIFMTKENIEELGIEFFLSNELYDDLIIESYNMSKIYLDEENKLYIYKFNY